MVKIFTTAFASLLTLLVMILSILMYDSGPTNTTKESIKQATQQFTDTVRQKGYVDPRDYSVFSKIISSYGVVAVVEIEHHRKRYQPLYDDPNDFGSFGEEFEVLYEGFFTNDILKVLYPGIELPDDSPQRRYNMNVGDFFMAYVRVKPSVGERLKSLVFNSTAVDSRLSFGGLVRDEP